jgi:UDP-N-acetylglucosamine--N-acetylmuramyl-(pentapeptide) pyrophosphoryl-undecaprenol N-acetylglucosamine transferase
MSRATRSNPWVVIAGGGTAGHVLPALAVAESLVEQQCPAQSILFVGSRRGIEARLVRDAGFPIELLPGRGIQRALTIENVKNLFALSLATSKAVFLLVRNRPAVVFSVGGYASVPCAFAAVVLRIPLVLAESNAKAGVAIRSVARFAKASATAFEGTNLPRAVVVGNPVRRSILQLAADPASTRHADLRMAARRDLGVSDDAPMVSVFGGSLGARTINTAVFDMCERWFDRTLVVHHVVGDRDFDAAKHWLIKFRESHPSTNLDYRQIRYEDRMDLVYGASDLVVCRAGATSIADLAIVGMPAILIPLPSAAEDHQHANAQAVENDGGCVLLRQDELTTDRFLKEIDGLLNSPVRRMEMAVAQRKRARPEAALRIAELLQKHATKHRSMPRIPGAGNSLTRNRFPNKNFSNGGLHPEAVHPESVHPDLPAESLPTLSEELPTNDS